MSSSFPHLKENLNLYESSRLHNGAPSYTLHDPVNNKFFQIGWFEFEVIKRWSFGNIKKIVSDIKIETTLTPEESEVEAFIVFLSQNNLLNVSGQVTTNDLLDKKAMQKTDIFKFLVKNYLFLRIPLINPDQHLSAILPAFKPFFSYFYLKIIALMAIIGAFLIFREWPEFVSGFKILQTPEGIIIGFLVLAVAKIIHELGHGLASKYYNCRVPAMGIAFIVMWPLLWTDTTEGWKLKNHKQRLMIDSGGMIAEICVAAIASILWVVLPDGNMKIIMHLLASTSWIMTLAVNLNPFMRFDGYYLLSDLTDKPNLQDRSFALAKWKIRGVLFGLRNAPPEYFNRLTAIWMVLYAIGTWIYRFFLFLGIAFLVYYFFFKALGVAMFIIELWWFIGKPIVNELKQWKLGMANVKGLKRGRAYLLIGLGLLMFLIIPLPHNITAPAIMKAEQQVPIIAPVASLVKEIHVKNGQKVSGGEVIITLESPELKNQYETTLIAMKTLQKEYAQSSSSATGYGQSNVQRQDLARLKSDLVGLKSEIDNLIVKAPYDGIIYDLKSNLTEGDWLKKRETLSLIVSENLVVEAFLKETDIDKISLNSEVSFYPKNINKNLKGEIDYINNSAITSVPYEELAHIYGGDIAVKMGANAQEGLKPEKKLYKVVITASTDSERLKSQVGEAHIRGDKSSFAWDMLKKIYSILIRESGF